MNYKNEKLDVEINSYISKNNEIWFRGKEIALILGYKNTRKAIIDHVDEDDKKLVDFKISTHVKSHNSRCNEKLHRDEGHNSRCNEKLHRDESIEKTVVS